MLLRFQDGRPFAQGACNYEYRPVPQEAAAPRIVVQIQIEDIETRAVVDTGGVYLVCEPWIADLLNLDPADALGTGKLNIRGVEYPGYIHRIPLTLMAQEGQSVKLEATAFVPNPPPYLRWELPSFMGLSGCLERLRFAVDPTTDTFYFGALEEE